MQQRGAGSAVGPPGWEEGDRFRICVRQHLLPVDQPEGDGGTGIAPTPTELFVASLASCVAFYARSYRPATTCPPVAWP